MDSAFSLYFSESSSRNDFILSRISLFNPSRKLLSLSALLITSPKVFSIPSLSTMYSCTVRLCCLIARYFGYGDLNMFPGGELAAEDCLKLLPAKRGIPLVQSLKPTMGKSTKEPENVFSKVLVHVHDDGSDGSEGSTPEVSLSTSLLTVWRKRPQVRQIVQNLD
jgi:hypothetical protein